MLGNMARFAYAGLLGAAFAGGGSSRAAAEPASEQDAHEIGVEAYLYFYPLVTMDLTRKQLTNVAKPDGVDAPMNAFASFPAFPPADMKVVVRPNFDTLYSSAWLDSDQRAGDRLGPRHAWALLPAADAGHVDRRLRLARLAHDRNGGRRLRGDASRLYRFAPGGRRSNRRAHALCLDHRPHQDGWAVRLRRRARDPGRLQNHAALAMGQADRAGGRGRRSRYRHEDAAEGRGRCDAGGQVLRLRRRNPQIAAAAYHRRADPRPDAANRDRARQELRHRQGRSGDQVGARERAGRRPEADGVEGRTALPASSTAGR